MRDIMKESTSEDKGFEKKRMTFKTKSRNTESLDSDSFEQRQQQRRSRSISFAWNKKFDVDDLLKRRRSLADPREIQKMREFIGKRFLGESNEFTNAHQQQQIVMETRVMRRHSMNALSEEEKARIISRATFATRYQEDTVDDRFQASSSVCDFSSSEGSLEEESKLKNLKYRVSFADPERVQAVQEVLKKNKSLITVLTRSHSDAHDIIPEATVPSAESAIRIFQTSSEDKRKRLATTSWRKSFGRERPSRVSEQVSVTEQTPTARESLSKILTPACVLL